MNPEMTYDSDGLHLTEQGEGLRLQAYKDPGGVWTNGYGNTHGVVPGSTITQVQAEKDLMANVQNTVNAVNRLVTVQLTQGEFDALVDFVFNIGVTAFAGSTMLKLVNLSKFAIAADQFALWDHCGGRVVSGLLRRRQMEEQEFKS